MDRTKKEGGGEGGKALCSWQVSSLVVGAGSSRSRSPGKGRGELWHQSHAPGCTASPGHRSTKHLTFHFLPCKPCVTSWLSVLLAIGDKTKQDIKTFFVA